MKRFLSLFAGISLLAVAPAIAQEAPAETDTPAVQDTAAAPETPAAPTSGSSLSAIDDPIGRAGMAAVTLRDAEGREIIMMAGGANFPHAKPEAKTAEERGAKVYYNDVVVKDLAGNTLATGTLPYSFGYAAFAPTSKGMVIAGGCNEKGHLATVLRIELNDGSISTTPLPDLPRTIANAAFAELDGKFYVMGGLETESATTTLYESYVLDLAKPEAGWQPIANMTQKRMLAAAGVLNGKIYVVGGCLLKEAKKDGEVTGERVYQKSVYCYDPAENKWQEIPGMPSTVDGKELKGLVGAANPLPAIDGKLYVIGGDPGEYYSAALQDKAPKVHPGQSRITYAFSPSTQVWEEYADSLPVGIATAPAVVAGGNILVISGETHPGIRTAAVSRVELSGKPSIAREPSPVVETTRSLVDACASFSGATLWCAGLLAVVAVLFGLRKGFLRKPLPKVAPKGNPGKWAWIAVAVLWFVVMLNYFDRQLLAVLNTSITEGGDGIPMSQAQFGLVTSIFLLIYAVLSPVGGYLADRFSRKFIIMISLVVWSVVTWWTGDAETYTELVIARACMGISEAFYIPAALALISDYHRGNTRSMATGLHMSGIYAGQVLAGYGAMMAGDPYCLGWRLTFETFGFIGVAYAIIVVLFLRDPEAPKDTAAEEEAAGTPELLTQKKAGNDFTIGQIMHNLFSSRAMAMLLIMYALAGFANWFILSWYPRLLQDMFSISEAEAGPQATLWVNIAKYITVLAAAVIADMWYTRNRNARAYVPGIAFTLAGPCIFLAMLPAIGLFPALGLTITLALVSTQGIAQGALDATLMPVLRTQIDERFSATAYGMLNFTSAGVGALISFAGGWLKDLGIPLGVPLCVAGALMLVCGLMFFFLPKQPAEKA